MRQIDWHSLLKALQYNERDNISNQELQALQVVAADLLALSITELNNAIQQGKLQEICDGQT